MVRTLKKNEVVKCKVIGINTNSVIVAVLDTNNIRGIVYRKDVRYEKTCEFEDYIAIGDVVDAKVLRIKKEKFYVLSIKAAHEHPRQIIKDVWSVGDQFTQAEIFMVTRDNGAVVIVDDLFSIHLCPEKLLNNNPVVGDFIDIEITEIPENYRIPQAKQINTGETDVPTN